MADSARGENGQGKVLHPSDAAVEAGSNGQSGLLSPRMKSRVSRPSRLVQEDSTSCRFQEYSEDKLGQSGRCCWAYCRPDAAFGVAVGGGLVV